MTLDEMRAACRVFKEYGHSYMAMGARDRLNGRSYDDCPDPGIRTDWEIGWDRMDRALKEAKETR